MSNSEQMNRPHWDIGYTEAKPKLSKWDITYNCSECHRTLVSRLPVNYKYCPHCGMRMDGKDTGEVNMIIDGFILDGGAE